MTLLFTHGMIKMLPGWLCWMKGTSMNHCFKVFLLLVFDTVNPVFIVFRGLYILGAWGLLKKSGNKPWYSLIPWVREYQLARCAGREPEGRVYSLTSCLITILLIVSSFLQESLGSRTAIQAGAVVLVIVVALMLVHFIYNIHVYVGFIELYKVRKIWLVLCIFDELRFIPSLVWGISKKYQPAWKLQDLKAAMKRLATHGSASVLDEGLTINLKDRTVKEFFRKKVLLKDIHMSIPSGHMVLLLGGSGAGKTTFVNAINGYEKANAEIMLNGTNMYTNYKKMMYEVGFVPQSEMMRGRDKVLNTLSDTAKFRLSKDIPRGDRKERVAEVEEIFGLKPVETNLVNKLSGGQKKRLSISMEMLSSPSLFILDEPDSGLDGVMARELFEQLRTIADSGKIVIVITHTPDRVIDLFDDVIVLAKDSTRTGRLAFYGSISEAREFFGKEKMEEIVKTINRREEGGDGLADEYVMKYAEVQYG